MVTDRVTEDTVAVSWEPVRAVVDKYVVRYTSAEGETRDTAVPREQNSTVLTGLKPGEAYQVYVWAERGRQQSRKADTGALTGTGPGRVPSFVILNFPLSNLKQKRPPAFFIFIFFI